MIGDFVNQIESLLLNLHVVVLQAVCDCLLMSLYSVVVDVYHFLQLLNSDIPHVILPVHQEAAKDVDAENSQVLRCLDPHYGPGAFREH